MTNLCVIMGRLTKDPELRRTQSGLAVTSFSLACERDYKDQQGNRETDFINCVAWRSTAEYVQKYFPKGRMATVTGRLQVRSYQDQNGNKRTATEILVDNIYPGDYSKPQSMQDGGSYGYQNGGYPAQTGYSAQGSYQGGYQNTGYQNGGYQGGYQRPNGSVIDNQFSDLSDDDDGTLPF